MAFLQNRRRGSLEEKKVEKLCLWDYTKIRNQRESEQVYPKVIRWPNLILFIYIFKCIRVSHISLRQAEDTLFEKSYYICLDC